MGKIKKSLQANIIFIVGYSRSGTKMMNRFLSISGVADFVPEIHFFEQFFGFDEEDLNVINEDQAIKLAINLLAIFKRGGDKLENGKEISKIEEDIRIFIKKSDRITKINIYVKMLSLLSTTTPIDPTPRNAYYIKEITALLPESRFLYMIRDPRDSVLSQKEKWKNYWFNKKRKIEAIRLWLNYNPIVMAYFWKNSLKGLERADGENILLVRYDDFTSDPDAYIDKIFDFLGVTVEYPDISFINNNNTGKWKKKSGIFEVKIVERITRSALTKYNYELSRKLNFYEEIQFICYVISFLFKIPFSIFLNFRRFNNVKLIIRKRLLGKNN